MIRLGQITTSGSLVIGFASAGGQIYLIWLKDSRGNEIRILGRRKISKLLRRLK